MERFTNREGTGLHESVLRRYIDKGKYIEETVDDLLKKMSCYENAEEDGRLIILPCRPGDKLYYIFPTNEICSFYVEKIEIHENSIYLRGIKDVPLSKLGETIFLTRADAERKKVELERGESK